MAKGTPSKQVIRMQQIRNIQSHLMGALFNDRLLKQQRDDEIRKIASANQYMLGANTPTFMFGSKWYPISDPSPQCNRTLHESFRVRVDELVNGVKSADRSLKAGITCLLGNVLSVARHIDDLYAIFPREIASILPVVDTAIFNIGSPLSIEEIADVNTFNATNIVVFHKLLMNRLLCAQVKP